MSTSSGYSLAARFPTDWPSRRVTGITLLALITTARHAVADRRARLYPHDAGTAVVLFFLFGMYNGAMVAALTEVMPVYVRTLFRWRTATAILAALTLAIFYRAGVNRR